MIIKMIAKLYNQTTAQVLILDEIKEIGIFYTVFGNIYYADRNLYGEKKNIPYFAKNQVSTEQYPKFSDFEIVLAIEAIKGAESGFDVAPNAQCWTMPEKAFRTIANEKLIKHIGERDDLGNLFLALQTEFVGQYFVHDGITFVYSSNIAPQYEPVLLAHPETITIEQYVS